MQSSIRDNDPVIIGCAQLVDRDATLERHQQPLEMLARVARDAAKDAGTGNKILEKLDTVAVIDVPGWQPDNAVDLLAHELGARPSRQYCTGAGGQIGVTALNLVAEEILAGRTELALIVGCNNLKVLNQAAAQGKMPDWTTGGKGRPQLIGGDADGSNALEAAYGFDRPIHIYPAFENALRAKLGLDPAAHRRRMGELFSRFTEIAADNPYAWFPVRRSPEELTTLTSTNRMIAFPYPKYLNAVLTTEQAAGLIVCSAAKAKALGIPREHWVYWWGGASSEERAWWPSERPDFTQCPAMKDTLVSALSNAELTIDRIDHMDFYSCFPVAVEMACEMLDLAVDDPRGFTVTGGLPYAGGPGSGYTLHSLAATTSILRASDDKTGLVTGNGWYLTKHSAAILSSAPKQGTIRPAGLINNPPSQAMETAPRTVDKHASGKAVIEAYTVVYDRDGKPCRGIALGSTAANTRFIANTPDDTTFLEHFVADEQVGTKGNLERKGEHLVFNPL